MSDYPQTAVSHIVRTRHFYFAQRDTTPACFGPFVTILKFLFLKGDDFSRIQDQLLIKRQFDGLIQLIHPVADKRL